MRPLLLGSFVLALILPPSAFAACTTSITLPESAASGSTVQANILFPQNWFLYEVNVEGNIGGYRDRFASSVILPVVPQTSFRLPRFSHADNLRFTVIFETDDKQLCAARANVAVTPDPQLAARTGALVVPVAASVEGANGSRFRTRLKMSGIGSGRIYFRRSTGFSGDTSDPSLPYQFAEPNGSVPQLEFDDIIGAMGLQGIGSLDIVPDITPVGAPPNFPYVEAEVYNDAVTGRFNSAIAVLRPRDLFVAGAGVHVIRMTPRIINREERVNFGVRTFESDVTATITLTGREQPITITRTFPKNTFGQIPLESLIGALPAVGGEVRIEYSGGPAAVYHSIVDNGTNDSTVIVPWAHSPLEQLGSSHFFIR